MTGAKTDIRADVVLPMSADRASRRLVRRFGTDGQPRALRMTVGPSRTPGLLAKDVTGRLTGPVRRGSTDLFTLHWEPTGFAAALYPTLDASLALTPVDERTSLLAIVAHYVPPMGTVGATVDRAGMSRVANATVSSVLSRLARALTEPATDLEGSVTP